MKRLIVIAALILCACSPATTGGGIPSLTSSGNARPSAVAAGGSESSTVPRPRVDHSANRAALLHAAAQCVRAHGVPGYQDPVLTADGHVYTDARSFEDATARASRSQEDALYAAIQSACGHLLAAAGMQPEDESPAPPALVAAGVRSAQCLRAHGLPNMRDPNSQTAFTPGHGFGLSADELPNNGALGKGDPTVQRALTACRSLLDAEIRASSLSSLAHG
jgi:hypothetical protein